jgi:hypothetical protein
MYGSVIVRTYYNEYWILDIQLLQCEDGNIHYAVFGQEETMLYIYDRVKCLVAPRKRIKKTSMDIQKSVT